MNLASDDAEAQARVAAFQQSLQRLGWSDGRNVRIDSRWAAGDAERTRRYAAEFDRARAGQSMSGVPREVGHNYPGDPAALARGAQ